MPYKFLQDATRRKTFSLLAAAASIAVSAPAISFAQEAYPSRPVEMVMVAAPGGGIDLFGRTVASVLNEEGIVPEHIQVTNLPGAGGSIAIAEVAQKRAGDPYALLGSALHVHLAPLTLGTPHSYKDLTPLAKLFSEYEVMAVRTDSPIKSLKDIEDALKKDPGSLKFAGGPIGNTDHITVAMFAQAVGADPTKVNFIPYSGSEINVAILGGHVDVGMGGVDLVDMAESGQMRLLGVSSAERLGGRAKDIPTFREQGYDVLLENWRGVFAAPGVEDSVKQYWIDALGKMVATERWKSELAKYQWADAFESGDAFVASLDAEHERYRELLGKLGLLK